MVASFIKKRPAKIVLNCYQNIESIDSNKMSSNYNSTSLMSEEAAGMIDYINTSLDCYSSGFQFAQKPTVTNYRNTREVRKQLL